MGETRHQSCCSLRVGKKPIGLASNEGKFRPVRSWQLTGLQVAEGQEIFKAEGFFGSEDKRKELINHYVGNPLALRNCL